MTTKSTGQVQLEVRLLQVAPDRAWGVFLVPGSKKSFKLIANQETLGEWINKDPGSNVNIRIASDLAERVGAYNQATAISGHSVNQTKIL
jgi:hypothetical protein